MHRLVIILDVDMVLQQTCELPTIHLLPQSMQLVTSESLAAFMSGVNIGCVMV